MHSASDIDILIIGSERGEDFLLSQIESIEKKIQREINYKVYSQKEFKEKLKGKDPFLQEVLSDKYILIKGKL